MYLQVLRYDVDGIAPATVQYLDLDLICEFLQIPH